MVAARTLPAALAIALAACAARPTDVAVPGPSVKTTSATIPGPIPTVAAWEVLAHVKSRAVAADKDNVYFGDEAAGLLLGADKLGGWPYVLGSPAPRAIALGPASIVWIGAPGNVVLRAPRSGGNAEVVREGAPFLDVVASGPDVFVTEGTPRGGSLLRITGSAVERLCNFDAIPRAVAVDGTRVYVQTPAALVAVPRQGGLATVLARGLWVSRLVMDDDALYTTALVGPSRAIVRVAKSDGASTVLEHGVRDGPIGVSDGWVYYLEEDEQPRLRRVAKTGGASALVASSDALRRVTALAVDAAGIYVATEEGTSGSVIQMPIIGRPPAARITPVESSTLARGSRRGAR